MNVAAHEDEPLVPTSCDQSRTIDADPRAIATATTVVSAFSAAGLAVDRVVADASEQGIAIYLFGGAPDAKGTHPRFAWISVGSDGEATWTLWERSADVPARSADLDLSAAGLRRAAEGIGVFLGGPS